MVKRNEEQEEDIQESGLMTVREFASRLRCDTTTVRRWIADGTLEAVTLPHRNQRRAYRIKQETLDKLLEGKTS